MDSPSPPPVAHPSPLEHFRARLKRLPLHPQENLLLWIISSHLVCLPWALGAMRWWAQVGSFVFAVIGFLVAIRSRSYTEEYTTASANFRLFTLPNSTHSFWKSSDTPSLPDAFSLGWVGRDIRDIGDSPPCWPPFPDCSTKIEQKFTFR